MESLVSLLFPSSAATTALLVILPLFTIGYVFSGLVQLLYRQQLSPLRRLRGPASPSWLLGNLEEMGDQENNNLFKRWEQAYGSTFVYTGFAGGQRLATTDPVAVAHILGNAYDYIKPEFIRDSLASMGLGFDGLLTVDGDRHKQQRRILNPAFTSTHIRSLVPIFWEKASQLRDIWMQEIAPEPLNASTSLDSDCNSSTNKIDILSGLVRATLDAIGIAGFGYDFNSLHKQEEDELGHAFEVIFAAGRKFRIMTVFQSWFPFLRRFRRNNATMAQAKAALDRIGSELIAERTENVMREMKGANAIDGDKTTLGRDLLSVIIRSSLSGDPSQRLSHNEAICQIGTFLVAGHETTSNALTWTLYALARDQRVQTKLRAEISGFTSAITGGEDNDTLTPELLDAVLHAPYLDMVVREVLRVHAPVSNTMRAVATDRDAIPVQTPFTDRLGNTCTAIEVRRHDIITIPIQAINKHYALWGPDADEFIPERWENQPEKSRKVPGLFANTLTFLNGNFVNGNRSCIGWQFALTEIKVFLYLLVRDINFSIDPDVIIEKRINVVTRPVVKSSPDMGNQMPLRLVRVSPTDTAIPAS